MLASHSGATLKPSATSSTSSLIEVYPEIAYERLPADQTQAASNMGHDEQLLKPEGRPGDIAALLTALSAAGVFLVTCWVLVLSNSPTSLGWFAWHPLLQSLAIFSFTFGILTLQPTSQPRTKAAGLLRHQMFMLVLGLPAILLGTLAMLWNKYIHESPHFTTWHGTFGIIAVSWMLLQMLLGAGSVWFGGRLFGGFPKAKLLWKYHRLSGYILFPVFLFTCHLGGAWSTWSQDHSSYATRAIAFTIAPLVIFAAIIVRVRPSKMKFF